MPPITSQRGSGPGRHHVGIQGAIKSECLGVFIGIGISTAGTPEKLVRDIRRATRKRYSAEEKIRIVLEGLRGEENISELCRREGIAASMYYGWSKEFLEAGKRRLAGDTAPAAEATQTKCEHALGRAAEGLRRLLVSRRQRPGGRGPGGRPVGLPARRHPGPRGPRQ